MIKVGRGESKSVRRGARKRSGGESKRTARLKNGRRGRLELMSGVQQKWR
jgi:hypothetical protein